MSSVRYQSILHFPFVYCEKSGASSVGPMIGSWFLTLLFSNNLHHLSCGNSPEVLRTLAANENGPRLKETLSETDLRTKSYLVPWIGSQKLQQFWVSIGNQFGWWGINMHIWLQCHLIFSVWPEACTLVRKHGSLPEPFWPKFFKLFQNILLGPAALTILLSAEASFPSSLVNGFDGFDIAEKYGNNRQWWFFSFFFPSSFFVMKILFGP